MLKISFGVAKVNKYASRESGDTFELAERPSTAGGITGILVDGQGSGYSAKFLSNFVSGHCATLIKQGVRDGVVARAANDQLYHLKGGQVSATLNLISADFTTRTLVISRNNPQPVYYCDSSPVEATAGALSVIGLNQECQALGIYPRTKPVITEFGLKPGLVVVAFTDGFAEAGKRYNETPPSIPDFLSNRLSRPYDAQALADELLELSMQADRRRPQDDTSVVVVTTHEFEASDGTSVPRRLSAEIAL
ncbi:MAG TPA: SpoIIE family protein phosphatase [Chloroflexia bacterium]|nr:SpoIIE family protein phosphatase [Chloroflexia bacterium]